MSLPPSPTPPGVAEPDPSMDDILASIRRILDDDQAGKAPGADVLVLDTSMMVEADTAVPATVTVAEPRPVDVIAPPEARAAEIDPVDEAATVHAPAPVQVEMDAPTPVVVPEKGKTMASSDDEMTLGANVPRDAAASLVAPAAAAAAANSVGALMRTLAAERSTSVSRMGATIEDLVREEIRPFLKEWLDTHLPPIVERLVQVEIERLVTRQAG